MKTTTVLYIPASYQLETKKALSINKIAPGWSPDPNWALIRLSRLTLPLIRLSRLKWPQSRLSRQNDLWSDFPDHDNFWSDGTQSIVQTIALLWSDSNSDHCPDYKQTMSRPKSDHGPDYLRSDCCPDPVILVWEHKAVRSSGSDHSSIRVWTSTWGSIE